jgi:hypothetical protein
MAQSNSNSEDDLHLNSNNSHDYNKLLLDGSKKNPDSSIFDDSSTLAMVSEKI